MSTLAFDRTPEFRSCAQSIYERVLSGRIKLRLPHSKLNNQNYFSAHNLINEFLENCKKVTEDINLTRLKLSKLKLLLQTELSEDCRKLMEILKVDVIDLNKVKFELRGYTSRLKNECIMNKQQLNHFCCIITSIEYQLSYIVVEFRNILEDNKNLFADYLSCEENNSSDFDISLFSKSNKQKYNESGSVFGFNDAGSSSKSIQSSIGALNQSNVKFSSGSNQSLLLPVSDSVQSNLFSNLELNTSGVCFFYPD